MAYLFDSGIFSAEGLDGAILVGATLTWYAAGTTTPLTTYSDQGLTTPNANPVVAGADGRWGPIWLQAASYKYVLKSAAGVTLVTRDNIRGDIDVGLRSALSASSGSSLIGYESGTVEDALVIADNATPDRLKRGEFTLPGTGYWFGDSFWEQPNGHTSSGNSMAYKASALLGMTASISATSGNTCADKQDAIFAANPAAGAFFATNLGQNDAQFIGTGSDIEARFNDVALIHLANHFQMAVPSGSRRILASAMTAAGTWATDTDIAEGGAKKSTTNGSVLQADVTDSRFIVVNFVMKTSSGGVFRVDIDSEPHYGSFDEAGFRCAPFANIPTNAGKTFARASLVFDLGRRKPVTAVQMFVTSATNASNIVSIHSVIGLSGDPLDGPLAVVCDMSDRGAAGYATATGSKSALPKISRIINQSAAVVGGCGGRMVLVPLSTALNPNSSLDTDEFHPNEDGATQGAQAIEDAVDAAAKDWSLFRPDLFAEAMVNGADGYVLLAGRPLVLDADRQFKRRLLSPNSIQGLAYASSALTPKTASSVQLGSLALPFASGWFFDGVSTAPRTVAQLPAAAAGYTGFRSFVTDSNAALTAGIGAIVAGGGANGVPVVCDGTNWRIG